MELYKMIKSTEMRAPPSLAHTLQPARYTLNPFMQNRTVVCFAVALN